MQTTMDLRSIFVTNGVGIVILLMLYYVSRTKILRRHTEDRLYSFMIFGVMLGSFTEALSYALDGKVFPGAIALNYLANTYLFSFNLLLPFCVIMYTDLGLYGDMKRIWKEYKPQIAVGAVLLAATMVNLFYPLVYYIDENNVYSRRPLGYVYYAVILYYLITAIVVTKRYEKEHGARTFFNINMFLVPILVGAGLQFAFYGLSVAWLASAIGLTGLYMMQQNETAYIDPLLEMYNRRYLDYILSSWISRGYSFTGMMIDIDGFKSINDSFGHSEGDKALMHIADILKKSAAGNEIPFRFAGDEFIVLRRTADRPDLSGYIAKMDQNLEKFNAGRSDDEYRLGMSYGISTFHPGEDSIDTFMKELDDRMYEMKAEHHKR